MKNIDDLLFEISNVSRETLSALEDYMQLVSEWNKSINLLSRNTTDELLKRHIVDCLQIMNFIKDSNIHVVDVGSGAGLPGVILSIAGIKAVTLVEANSKKSAFLLQAAQISSNKIEIINGRIEDINIECDIVTSRALADLEMIFNYVEHLEIKDKYLLLKGAKYQEELIKAQKNWQFDHVIYDSILSNTSKILEINNLVRI
ncbi:Ribosomal RNA small subunit methyltransferase G [Candidatus Trichorickettsia mobilis]|uniref:Ribosomal RNA small subunit methyltransferase G n=1 Tax=Candidatus Trichorickettsia mobilis TaxID=1346319 RepID=A0ABZ0USJ6_9RICK|nr:16S rRNA (guanine(527)-N(7))-methyltransferase RsmG [Candidatus Trichorickettsia mobilis]WPY00786.1 Ribosomal RNA small subunit methyltransferase G [Candidatus Trichorickettsia mobilis]